MSRAIILPVEKTFCTLVTHLTLTQLRIVNIKTADAAINTRGTYGASHV